MPPYFPLCTGARVIETRDIATTEEIISSVSHFISTVTLSVSRYHNSYFARYHGRYGVGKSAVFDVCPLVTRSLTIVANKKQYPHQRNVSRVTTHILVFSPPDTDLIKPGPIMFQSGTNTVSSAATGGPSSGIIMYWKMSPQFRSKAMCEHNHSRERTPSIRTISQLKVTYKAQLPNCSNYPCQTRVLDTNNSTKMVEYNLCGVCMLLTGRYVPKLRSGSARPLSLRR